MTDARGSGRGIGPRGMRVIAVTGSAGKTTTAWLIASVLGEAGLRVGVVSDLGCIDAAGGLAPPPDPSRPAAAWVASLARGGCTHAVVEVSHDTGASGGLGRGSRRAAARLSRGGPDGPRPDWIGAIRVI